MKKFAFSLLLALSSCAPQHEVEAIVANNKGVDLLKNDNPVGAQSKFVEGLAAKPFESVLHNNLGVALDSGKDIEKAIKAYGTAAEKANDPATEFAARFNMGQALAKQGKIDEALHWYQLALQDKPESVETKTNIELLISQNQQSGGQGKGEGQDQKDKKNDKGDGDDQKDKQDKKSYAENQKYKPRPFKGDLSESDVKKILGELKQQEQKIRADYNRKEAKEAPRDKDW